MTGPSLPGAAARMKHPLESPENLLAFKPLKRVLAAKRPGVHLGAHPGAPGMSMFDAMRLMADKENGVLVVLDGAKRVGVVFGVVSERDDARNPSGSHY